jgi:hypothetical protein
MHIFATENISHISVSWLPSSSRHILRQSSFLSIFLLESKKRQLTSLRRCQKLSNYSGPFTRLVKHIHKLLDEPPALEIGHVQNLLYTVNKNHLCRLNSLYQSTQVPIKLNQRAKCDSMKEFSILWNMVHELVLCSGVKVEQNDQVDEQASGVIDITWAGEMATVFVLHGDPYFANSFSGNEIEAPRIIT